MLGPARPFAELNPCSMIKFLCFDELILRLLIVFPFFPDFIFFNEEKVFSDVFSDVDVVVIDFDPNS